MHYRLSEKACLEYLSTGKLPSTVRPSYCQTCGASGKFHRHSSYHRKKVYVLGQWLKGGLHIQRFLCTDCKKVFSLIPLFEYFGLKRPLYRELGPIKTVNKANRLSREATTWMTSSTMVTANLSVY
ncbi:MAG: hypothetical protein PHE41_07075 [Eubacteriales bacterium]|nr:hypothetical protein [Eubacteriales bacterium]